MGPAAGSAGGGARPGLVGLAARIAARRLEEAVQALGQASDEDPGSWLEPLCLLVEAEKGGAKLQVSHARRACVQRLPSRLPLQMCPYQL